MPAFRDITGQQFGRLRVTRFVRKGSGGSYWECLCECGNLSVVRIGKLSMGLTRSCGCLRLEITAQLKFDHGHAKAGLHTTQTIAALEITAAGELPSARAGATFHFFSPTWDCHRKA